MKKFWRLIYFITAILVTLMVIGIWSSESGDSTEANLSQYSPPQQAGYFKADNNNRVFTFTIDPNMPESEIRSHADGRMHTTGRVTYVFYYYRDSPNPTTAGNLDRALQITENSDLRYSFMKIGDGSGTFTKH